MRAWITLIVLLLSVFGASAQQLVRHYVRGVVVNTDLKPVAYAGLHIAVLGRSAVADGEGNFEFGFLPEGDFELFISCLGYASSKVQLKISPKSSLFRFVLKQKSFALDDVVVTAKAYAENTTTAYEIGADALSHAQMTHLSELSALLPGGETRSKDLVYSSRSRLALRSVESEKDRPSFGTAIEVDGVRLSNNADFAGVTEIRGADLRIISPTHLGKVSIISGIPSVEYGDLSSGLVLVSSKQGVMPLNLHLSMSPRQKQLAASKGWRLGKNAGVLNVGYDFSRSTANIASPHTAYVRNAFTLKHKKTLLRKASSRLMFTWTAGGNLGGYRSDADPDTFKDSYVKKRAFNLRGGINLDWRLSAGLLSEARFSATLNYNDHKETQYGYHSAAASTLAFHGTEKGYFVGKPYAPDAPLPPIQLLKRGYWRQTKYIDSKPMNYGFKLKLQKNNFGKKITSKLKFGSDFSASGNFGRGVYYRNRAYTPTWRAHRYDRRPHLHNLAVYAEEKLEYRFGNRGQKLWFVAGIRSDYTFVEGSAYRNMRAFSPRFNLRHQIIDRRAGKFVRKLSWYAGWGLAVKLPAFGVLYSPPGYKQRLAFAPTSLADGSAYYAYYIEPSTVAVNQHLRQHKNRQFEVGINLKVGQLKCRLAYFNTLSTDRYSTANFFKPFIYYLTQPEQLAHINIPHDNRYYTIDQDGTVSVHDKQKIWASQVLDKKEKRTFKYIAYANNGSPINRRGIEWVLDFGKIKPLHTALRIDGKYYFYSYLNQKISASYQGDNQLMTNGQPYQYIGYYYGGNSSANGERNATLRANATLITHIPKLRVVVSLKLEGVFISSGQNLSEMPGGLRSFAVSKVGETLPGENPGDIYAGKNFAVSYPLYYSSFEDEKTRIPFKEKYLWAYKNDKNLFIDLSKMVKTTNNTFYFKRKSISPYFFSNVKVSKEMGKRFKLTFYAHNFLNTMAKIKDKQENITRTLLNGGRVAAFSYGMSLNVTL